MSEEKSALSWEMPGKVSVAGERGYYDGCEAVGFQGTPPQVASQINEYFSRADRKQHMVVYAYPTAGGVIMLHGRWMNGEERLEFDHFSRAMGVEMQKFREAAAETKRKDKEAQQKEIAERTRLIEVGKKCEVDHGAVVKKLRDEKKGKR